MYVLENEAANPLEGTWVERDQIKTNWESFSLDATTFEHDSTPNFGAPLPSDTDIPVPSGEAGKGWLS